MFSFRKKDKERDKDKKEKNDKKKKDKDEKVDKKQKEKKERQNMTPEDLSRIEEMKKGVIRSDSSHGESSSARSTLTKPQSLPQYGGKGTASSKTDSSPAVKLKPKVKSILKGQIQTPSHNVDLDDSQLLQKNTKLNENLFVSTSLTDSGEPSISTTTHYPSSLSPSRHSETSLTEGLSSVSITSTPSTPPEVVEEVAQPEPPYSSKLKLPQIVPLKAPRIREIIVKRNQYGGFGFSLRKGMLPSHDGGPPKAVTFAEPGSGPSSSQTGLLPGDRLIEVNNQNIEKLSREEIVEIIKTSGDTLALKVQPIPELIELSVRPNKDGIPVDIQDTAAINGSLIRSGDLRHEKGAKSEDDVKSEEDWLRADKAWLLHKGGFTMVSMDSKSASASGDGRIRVQLETGDAIDVDEDDIEKANPPQFDRVEDLTSLRYLNESSALHTLRQRYGVNLIHTYLGPHLIVINPMQTLPLYAEKVIQMLKGCKQEDMPPHIFSKGQMVYRELMNTRRDQAVVLMGRTGSGKTTNAQNLLHYLITAAGTTNHILTVEKLACVYTLLHAFGNSHTSSNINASRFTQVFCLDFDQSGQIGSASVQALLFEKSRVVRRAEGEPNYSIFYQFLAGVEGSLRNDLHLQSLSDSNLFMIPLQKSEDQARAADAWANVLTAMDTLNFSEEEVKAILCVLSAIYHLGNASASKGTGPNNKPQFAKPGSAQKAASLLGTDVEELTKCVFSVGGGTSTLSRATSLRIPSNMDKPSYHSADTGSTPMECLEGFVIGLYSDLFQSVISLINRSLSSNMRAMNSITVLDSPGFQTSGTRDAPQGRSSGASFEDLCHNYAQEKLQGFFHELTIAAPRDRYIDENIELDFEPTHSGPNSMVNMLDKPPPQGMDNDHKNQVRSSISDLKSVDTKGLLWILDEEAMFPGATVDTFMDRLLQQHSDAPVRKDSLLRKGSLGNTFVLSHNQGTIPVQYNAQGWLKACRENPISKNATILLQDSKKSNISQLFLSAKGQGSSGVGGQFSKEGSTTSLRRMGSMRRNTGAGGAGLKKKSVCLQVKFTVDSLMELLRKANVHFVHCVLPHHHAGLGDPTKHQVNQDGSNVLNVPLVRNQLRCFQVLDALRLYRQGFPDSLLFQDFISKFEPLVPGLKIDKDHDMDQHSCRLILDHLDVDRLNYRVGTSRIFFRIGCLSQLELNRDEKFTGVVEQFQALCRGYLGRKKLERLQVQHKAIRCIQRNVQRYMQVRDWEWWRLYTKVKPILNVHRTEEELKEREAEIELLKVRSEKLEKERNEYKVQCDKLENRLVEVSADLAEENTTSDEAAELLEVETAERLRIEKEFRDLQAKFSTLEREKEKLDIEVMQTRLWQMETVEDDIEGGKDEDSVYKPRYERVMKELQVTKKQMQQHHEEEMEQEFQSRKLIERRLHEAVAEAEEQRRQVQLGKKKIQRLGAEAQDTKLHLEEQMSRNNELERKQRRFDSELSMAHEDVREEKTLREKLQRERDELLSEKYTFEQSIQQLRMDLDVQVEKNERQEKEMNDLLVTGKDNNEVMNLKKTKHELDKKVQEQEEELDEQAGQIQMLEQAKLRLEMNMERVKQTQSKELEEKDEEIEEMRYKTQKKLRQMESQLEEEYEQKKKALEEKGAMERKLQQVGDRGPQRDAEQEKRLKKNLRKTKALLNDASHALTKQKDSEGTKSQIASLRNQLEDAEFALGAAVKAKKRMELEVAELQQQLEELTRGKQEAEAKSMAHLREKTDLQSRVEDSEEDMNELMKKYKNAVQQHSVDQITLTDQLAQIGELSTEKGNLKQKISELQSRLSTIEESTVDKHVFLRLETKVRDLEGRLELEVVSRQRLEGQASRYKDQIDKITTDKDEINLSKLSVEENSKRLQKQVKELREEFGDTQKREMEATQKKKELEARVEELEGGHEQNQSDLKLALKRITDLQAALEEDLDSDSENLMSDSDGDVSDDDDDAVNFRRASAMVNHRDRISSTEA